MNSVPFLQKKEMIVDKHENIDAQTIEKYIQYFKDAFILQEANRYDIRGKKEIGAFYLLWIQV